MVPSSALENVILKFKNALGFSIRIGFSLFFLKKLESVFRVYSRSCLFFPPEDGNFWLAFFFTKSGFICIWKFRSH